MSAFESGFLVAMFLIWCAILFGVTALVLASWQKPESKILWIIVIWTAPLLGLILWASFGRRKEIG